MDGVDLTNRCADQMAVLMARSMVGMRKVQVGMNAPLAACSAILALRMAPRGSMNLYSLAIGGVYDSPQKMSLFADEWDTIERGAAFSVEAVIDLMSGWEGVGDEPVRPLEVDPFGNVNLSGIASGDATHRRSLMGPGPAGVDVLCTMASGRSMTLYVTRHTQQTLVPRLSLATGWTWIEGGEDRLRSGLGVGGWSQLITDLGMFRFTPQGPEVVSIHPWVDLEAFVAETCWEVEIPDDVVRSIPPSARELDFLNEIDPHRARALEWLSAEQRWSRAVEIWESEAEGQELERV